MIKEKQTKTTMSYHNRPTRMANVKKMTLPNVSEEEEQLNTHILLVGICICSTMLENYLVIYINGELR